MDAIKGCPLQVIVCQAQMKSRKGNTGCVAFSANIAWHQKKWRLHICPLGESVVPCLWWLFYAVSFPHPQFLQVCSHAQLQLCFVTLLGTIGASRVHHGADCCWLLVMVWMGFSELCYVQLSSDCRCRGCGGLVGLHKSHASSPNLLYLKLAASSECLYCSSSQLSGLANEPTSSHEDAKQCASATATEQESSVITWEKLQCAAKIHKHIQKIQ